MFAVNLPTPDPSLEKGGERRYYANSKIYSILPVQSAPLPAGREGSGVGRSPKTTFRSGLKSKISNLKPKIHA